MSDTYCQYCWSAEGHREGCPALTDDPKVLEEWKRGCGYGWNDNYIPWYQYRFYSKTFMLGYCVGKTEIDILVDEVAQSKYA